jgi:serine/threonine protein kinase
MIGTSLGHYRIVAELGRGGIGIVYRAEDTRLERTSKELAPRN